MSENSNQKNRSLRETASGLSLSIDGIEIDACQSTVNDLATTARRLYQDLPQAETTIQDNLEPVNDEYGSLLHVYKNIESEVESGPLSDICIGIKDNIAVEGLPMTCGSSELSYTPQFDASVITRLRQSGAAIVGKTNMDAFAFGPSGEFSGQTPVTNPIAPDHVPGGSSSGSGAAVAAGLVDAALGTDTGGSVRIPAACCGVVGFKPTRGAVPNHGLVPFSPSLDTIGPITNSVETAAKILEIIAGQDVRDQTSNKLNYSDLSDCLAISKEAIEIGVLEPFFDQSSDEVVGEIRPILQHLESESHMNIQPVKINPGSVNEAYYLIGATEFSRLLRQNSIEYGLGTNYNEYWWNVFSNSIGEGVLNSHIIERVLPSAHLDKITNGRAYVAAKREAITFTKQVESAFDEVDVLVTPTIRTVPPKKGEIDANTGMDDLLGNTAPFNLSGSPAITVPVAEIGGLPISVQIVAPKNTPKLAFQAAHIFESEHAC